MGLFSKDIKTMDDLFVHTLKDIYYAENQIAKSLPDMVEKATDGLNSEVFERPGLSARELEDLTRLLGVLRRDAGDTVD